MINELIRNTPEIVAIGTPFLSLLGMVFIRRFEPPVEVSVRDPEALKRAIENVKDEPLDVGLHSISPDFSYDSQFVEVVSESNDQRGSLITVKGGDRTVSPFPPNHDHMEFIVESIPNDSQSVLLHSVVISRPKTI